MCLPIDGRIPRAAEQIAPPPQNDWRSAVGVSPASPARMIPASKALPRNPPAVPPPRGTLLRLRAEFKPRGYVVFRIPSPRLRRFEREFVFGRGTTRAPATASAHAPKRRETVTPFASAEAEDSSTASSRSIRPPPKRRPDVYGPSARGARVWKRAGVRPLSSPTSARLRESLPPPGRP